MERVLFDTNVILDVALKRLPHFDHAAGLFALIDKKIITGYATASTITDIYFISKHEKGHRRALEFITDFVEIVEIVGVDKEVIVKALNSNLKDFEDAVQVSAAEFNGIDCVITRNEKDFLNSTLKIFNPKEFLEKAG